MTNPPLDPEKYVEERIDQTISQAGQYGITTRTLDKALAADLTAAIENGLAAIPSVEPFVRRVRENWDKRNRDHRFEALLHTQACLRDETILGTNDPTLDVGCALGNGHRKAFRWLTVDDGDAMMESMRRNFEAVGAAYHANAAAWADIKSEMRQHGYQMVQDIFRDR